MSRLTREQWQSLITQYESSRLTQTEFCKQHNLNLKYFILKRSKHLPHTNTATPFIQSTRVTSSQPSSEIELQVGAIKLKLSDQYHRRT
ncbi:IS66 family insertion sequence element accessory protein TnpA [Halioxenophilus sp. WMMB6]|uniref:IS66 family insertion sequence element accessory protein TnpA n=1 Tax=Halioxenophilus sp. WMMB6 TaxID=3073815 RepID=UPI00295EACFE|nr:hypothetical protein [Halioxenophilus sp. WMMB6]